MIESFSEENTLIIKLCPMWSAKDDSIIVHFQRPVSQSKGELPCHYLSVNSEFLSKLKQSFNKKEGGGSWCHIWKVFSLLPLYFIM